jgi:hypothetical protein
MLIESLLLINISSFFCYLLFCGLNYDDDFVGWKMLCKIHVRKFSTVIFLIIIIISFPFFALKCSFCDQLQIFASEYCVLVENAK